MKKIFKHLCLCLCLVMVGLLCFNAKPKASLFGQASYNIPLEFPSNYEEESYVYGVAWSYVGVNSSIPIYLNYSVNNDYRSMNIGQFNNNNSLIIYNDISTLTLVNKPIENVETSIFAFYFTNVFINGNLHWNVRLIQFDYSKENLIDENDISTLSNAFIEIYNYNFIADSVNSLVFKNSYSLYYIEFVDLDTFNQITNSNYLVGYYLIWNYYNSNIEGIGQGPNVSSFYNYAKEEYNKGVDEGLELGFDLGAASVENIPGTFLTPIFNFIDHVFNLEVMPNIKIGYFIIIPLVFGVLGVVLYFWRKD